MGVATLPRFGGLTRTRATTLTGPLGIAGTAAAVVLGLLVLIGIAGPWVWPVDPNALDVGNGFAGVSASHPMGTDNLGRDILARVVLGARTALLGPALVIATATVVGTVLGVGAAWRGGASDWLTSRLVDTLLGIPGIVFALVAVATFGSGLTAPVIALAVAYTPWIARVVRSVVARERRLPYVQAAWVLGVSPFTICVRHLLPNTAPVIAAQAAAAYGFAMLDIAAVTYLGLGVQPPTNDWGLLVASGQGAALNGHPGQAIFAGSMIVIVVVCCLVIADRLSSRLESR